MDAGPPDLSVVLPVYHNRETLRALHENLSAVLGRLGGGYELIFVNDACPEGSGHVLEQMARDDARVAVLTLERNMGQQRAVLTGLRRARGRWVVVMDADLQDPPEAIPALLDAGQMSTAGQPPAAAVFAGRRGRYESPLRLLTSRMFKRAMRFLCGVPADAGLYVAMNREMIKRVLALDNPRPHLVAMIGCAGLPVVSIPVRRAERTAGRSAYTSWDRFEVAWDALTWTLAHKLRARGART
jgi:glycosyltransferase involved in cell wall biosynthesis